MLSRFYTDIYHRNNTRPDGSQYYDLLLVYVDDVFAIIHDPKSIMERIRNIFEINNDKFGPPTCYIAADVEKFQLQGDKESWSLTSNSYVKVAVYMVKDLLAKYGRELKNGKRPHK